MPCGGPSSAPFPFIDYLCALWKACQPTLKKPSNGIRQADAELQTTRHGVHAPRQARRTRHTPRASAHEAPPARESNSTSPLESASSTTHGNGSDPRATIDQSRASSFCDRREGQTRKTRDHRLRGAPSPPTPGPCCRAELEEFFGMPCVEIEKAPLDSESEQGNSSEQPPDSDGICQQGVSPDLCSHMVSMPGNARLDAADTREAASRSRRLHEVLIRLQERRAFASRVSTLASEKHIQAPRR